jgi:hypothetical protein
MRRLEKMEIEKKEAQDLKAAEARSTCEECEEYGHVHKDCPEEAKVLDYMRTMCGSRTGGWSLPCVMSD